MQWTPKNIKWLRKECYGESQEEFAKRFRLTVHAVRRWEYGQDEPSGPATIILDQLHEMFEPTHAAEK